MIPISPSNLVRTKCVLRSTRRWRSSKFNPGHSWFQMSKRNPSELWAQRSMAPTAQVRQVHQRTKPLEKARPAASPAKTSLLQQPALRRAPSPTHLSTVLSPSAARVSVSRPRPSWVLTSPERRRSFRQESPQQWAGCGPATHHTGPRLGKEQKAKDGAGQVPAVEFSLRGIHSVAGNDAVFAPLLGPLCMDRTISLWKIADPNHCNALQNRSSLQLQRPWQPLAPFPDMFSTAGPV